jgi:2-dehydro-3-deoxy-L-rhamnonate dehydrogenase (NAD+)
MSRLFRNQVAVVTGGGSGIGLACAERFGRGGAAVALFDVNAGALASAARGLRAQGITCVECAVDVTDEASVESAFAHVVAQLGCVDVLVQAAGITGVTGIRTEEVVASNFDLVYRINVKGIFLCCKHALRQMKAQGYGRIVNIASVAGKEGNAGMLAYSTSKAAVIGLTKVIGKEYAETGITVNCVAPAVVRTPMVAAMPEHQVKYMTDKIPMKRCGELDEIASLVAFIASKEAAFTTAFCWDATGGRATY